MILLLLQLALRPDLTPGAARPTTKEAVCAIPWAADVSSAISATVWRQALTRYGIAWDQRTAYLPTLAIPTALGGTRVVDNLWPAPKASEWNQARKQQVEHRVYDELCRGRVSLHEAQQKAGVGWETAWRIYFAK